MSQVLVRLLGSRISMPDYTLRSTVTGQPLAFFSPKPLTPEDLKKVQAALEAQERPTAAPVPTTPYADPGYDPTERSLPMNVFLETLNVVPKMVAQGAQNLLRAAQGKTPVPASEQLKRIASPSSLLGVETVLEEAGMPAGTTRKVAGFVGDLLTPGVPLGKVLAPVGKTVRAAGEYARTASKGVDDLTRMFVQYPGLQSFVTSTGESARDALRLRDAQIAGYTNKAKEAAAQIFKGISAADREKIAFHIDDPAQFPLPANRPELARAAQEFSQRMSTILQTDVAKGLPTRLMPDYVPYVVGEQDILRRKVAEIPELFGTTRFSKARKYPSLSAVKAAGGIVDPAELAVIRERSSARAWANIDLTRQMAAEFGTTASTAGARKLDMNRVLLPDTLKRQLKNTYFPEKIAKELEDSAIFYKDVNPILRAFRGTTRLYKTVQTTLNPAYYANNIQGNLTGQVLGGMDPETVVPRTMKATTEVARLAKPQNTLRRTKLTANLTYGQAFDAANEFNLFGGSEAAAEFARVTGKTGLTRPTDIIRAAGAKYVEDPARWALFTDRLRKGDSVRQAAIHVKNFLFDYDELTPFEKGLRDYGLVPYYAWKRKIYPALFRGAGLNTQKLRRLQLYYDVPDMFLEHGEEPLALPEWAQSENYVPQPASITKYFGKDPRGTELMRVANPIADLNDLANIRGMTADMLGEIPKASLELLTGQDLRTGRQLVDPKTGLSEASPLGAFLENQRIAGRSVPSGGTRPFVTEEGDITLKQEPVAAFVTRHLPIPMLSYAQQVAGDVRKPQDNEMWLKNTLLRGVGLTPYTLSYEAQNKAYEDRLLQELNDLERENLRLEGDITEEALRPPRPVESSLWQRLLQQESGANPNVRMSPKGAIGIAQVLPTTAADPGITGAADIFSLAKDLGISIPNRGTITEKATFLLQRYPELNEAFGRQYFAALLSRYNQNIPLALAAYNAGIGRVDNFVQTGEALPKETQQYVASILRQRGE